MGVMEFRKKLLTVCLLLLACSLVAQRNNKILNRPYADLKQWHLGFSVGMLTQNLEFTHLGPLEEGGRQYFASVPGFSPGFTVNLLADLRLHQFVNLRFSPGMYFAAKTVHILDYDAGTQELQSVKNAYVALPIDLKLSGQRLRNSRPYVTLGAIGTLDVAKTRLETLAFRSTDLYLTAGLGCDFYLPFFKLNPEIKFCFGLTDILRHDRPDLADDPVAFEVTNQLKKVKSKMFILTFYFE